jgi:lipopolysaccharide export system protein LptC
MMNIAAPRPGAPERQNSVAHARGILSGSARDHHDFASAERHSRRVRVLKLALPVLAVLMAAGFAGYSWLVTPQGIAVDVLGTTVSDGKLVMASPKLDGFTKDDLPYSLSAARAIQELGNTDVITLEQIDAKLPFDGENFATITAPSGVYDRNKNTLDVNSEMTVTTTDGMTARLQSARVDIGAGTLTTGDPVSIRLDGSRIAADSMTVSDEGKVLVFEKRVRVEIDSEAVRSAQASGGGGTDVEN